MTTESTTQSSTSGSTLGAHVQDYLRLRRALGFKLERAGLLLPQLVAYLEAVGATTVTSDLAIAWARLPERAQPNHWAQRLAVARWVRCVTCSRSTRPPRCRRPGCSPPGWHRPTPYLWSTADICSSARRGGHAAAAVAGGDPPDAVRADRGLRDAAGRDDRPGPRRRRLRHRCHQDPTGQVRPLLPASVPLSHPSCHHRRPLRGSCRRAGTGCVPGPRSSAYLSLSQVYGVTPSYFLIRHFLIRVLSPSGSFPEGGTLSSAMPRPYRLAGPSRAWAGECRRTPDTAPGGHTSGT